MQWYVNSNKCLFSRMEQCNDKHSSRYTWACFHLLATEDKLPENKWIIRFDTVRECRYCLWYITRRQAAGIINLVRLSFFVSFFSWPHLYVTNSSPTRYTHVHLVHNEWKGSMLTLSWQGLWWAGFKSNAIREQFLDSSSPGLRIHLGRMHASLSIS